MLGVVHLRVKAHAVETAGRILEGGERTVGGPTGDAEAGRRGHDRVAMAHPDDLLRLEPGEENRIGRQRRGGPAVLPLLAAGHFAARGPRHPLHAVADAEHRDPEGEHVEGGPRRLAVVDALRSSGEDDPGRLPAADFFRAGPRGKDDRENASLPDPARDQLRVLRSEVQDDDSAAGGSHAAFRLCAAAIGAARSAAGRAARAAAAKGASPTRTGATRAPGASRTAARSPSKTMAALAMRKSTAKDAPKARA